MKKLFWIGLGMILGGSITRLCAVGTAMPGKTEMLSSTLALPAIYFHDPESIEEWIEGYHKLKDWIQERHPGAEVLVTRIDNPPSDPHWFRIPFIWNGMHVWVKYHHIYDMKEAA